MRTGLELAEAERRLEAWQRVADRVCRPIHRDFELRNMLTIARLITRAARERDESRGCHFRGDHPQRNDAAWHADLELQRAPGGEVETRRVPLAAASSGSKP